MPCRTHAPTRHLAHFAPGNYTAQVTGKNNFTGTALVEVYEVNN